MPEDLQRWIPEGHQLTLTFVDVQDVPGLVKAWPGCEGVVVVHVDAKGNLATHGEWHYGVDPLTNNVAFGDTDAPEWCSPGRVRSFSDSLHT